MKTYGYTIVIDKDEDGKFLAICPLLQGCYAEGDTIEEAKELIEDANKLHLQDRIENHESIRKKFFRAKSALLYEP
jgi:predicted RNase H-like HicB family nuclease